MRLANVTLEVSLKPFWEPDHEAVCRRMFRQWLPLIERAEQVSVLLWVADGSEILDYRGDLDSELEWARYIGGANPRQTIAGDPEGVCLHSRSYLYRPHPPRFTLRDLAKIVAALRHVGTEVTGLPVRIGETFDPGPEFARSPFKYERHNEVCLAGTMGSTSFVCCYGRLHADKAIYAGFPEGIPEGTPMGRFLGRQAQRFLTDLGFDYLWLSNGFGFGTETWAATGALFDGQAFHRGRVPELREKQLEFWRLFREECPDFPLEVRGTNLTTGVDLSSDGVPLDAIYRGGFGIAPPPNSPWAALNGDFGLELTGYMSHIAELPGRGFPFRYYVHDPWWLNSPWLDRYGREPHDIYLPLSVARVDAAGRVEPPSSVAFLTVDDSYGQMPDVCPREVLPHVMGALDDAPDEAGPIVWVYPWNEYHEMTFGEAPRLDEVFFGDWFIRAAINDGLPLNSVVSSANYVRAAALPLWQHRVLVSIVPDAGSPLSNALRCHAETGGRLLLYGPAVRADGWLLASLGLKVGRPIDGQMRMRTARALDDTAGGTASVLVEHSALLSGGPVAEMPADDGPWLALLDTPGGERVAAVQRGSLAWVRGVDTATYTRGAHLVSRKPAGAAFPGPSLMRLALDALGYHVSFGKLSPDQPHPITCFARHAGGWFLSGYTPDTTVETRLRLPQGAPILVGAEAELRNGRACYRMPRAWHRECRVFVEQERGVVSCREVHSGEIGVRRRLQIDGLSHATVRFWPEPDADGPIKFLADPSYPYQVGRFLTPAPDPDHPGCLRVSNVSGSLLISW